MAEKKDMKKKISFKIFNSFSFFLKPYTLKIYVCFLLPSFFFFFFVFFLFVALSPTAHTENTSCSTQHLSIFMLIYIVLLLLLLLLWLLLLLKIISGNYYYNYYCLLLLLFSFTSIWDQPWKCIQSWNLAAPLMVGQTTKQTSNCDTQRVGQDQSGKWFD